MRTFSFFPGSSPTSKSVRSFRLRLSSEVLQIFIRSLREGPKMPYCAHRTIYMILPSSLVFSSGMWLIDLSLRALSAPISFSRVAWSILDCARRTSTFLSCAFREQEDDQAALPLLCSGIKAGFAIQCFPARGEDLVHLVSLVHSFDWSIRRCNKPDAVLGAGQAPPRTAEPVPWAPHTRLAWRLDGFVTNSHESCGLVAAFQCVANLHQ
jgi:hypothetical protein